MATLAPFNPPVDSTAAPATNPSTAALLAELDSTNFGYQNSPPRDRLYQVYALLGGDTNATWVIEQASSTNIASSAILVQKTVRTAAYQTSQFVLTFKLAGTDRIRVRHPSSLSGVYAASLQAQELA